LYRFDFKLRGEQNFPELSEASKIMYKLGEAIGATEIEKCRI
jgi:hypothetical protein